MKGISPIPQLTSDPYLRVSAFGLAPAQCVVFEDSEPGAEAGRAAGCVVVQVPDLHATPGDFADHIAPSLMEGARMVGLV